MESTNRTLSDELYASRVQVVKYELIIDAIRQTVNEGSLSAEDEEYLLFALNPTELGTKEMELLNLPHNSLDNVQPKKRDILKLKYLVEKQLNNTFAMVDDLDRTVDSIKDPDLPGLVNDVLSAELSLKNSIQELYRNLKILHRVDAKDANIPIQNSLNCESIKSKDLLKASRNEVDALLADILDKANGKILKDIVHDLESALACLTEELNSKRINLEKYRKNEEQLLSLAAELQDLNEGIARQSAAYAALTLDSTVENSTLENSFF